MEIIQRSVLYEKHINKLTKPQPSKQQEQRKLG